MLGVFDPRGNPLNPRLKPWDKREFAKKVISESLQDPYLTHPFNCGCSRHPPGTPHTPPSGNRVKYGEKAEHLHANYRFN